MTLRSRLFIIITIIVLFILSVSIFLVVRGRRQAAGPAQTGNEKQSPIGITSPLPSGEPGSLQAPSGVPAALRPSTEEVQKNAAKQLAKIFAERYFTYSTDNNYQNIREVESLVTPNLWSRISSRLNSPQTSKGFIGVTVRVITTELAEWQAEQAKVNLRAMKSEEKDGAINSSYQDVSVWVVKQAEGWRVERFQVL